MSIKEGERGKIKRQNPQNPVDKAGMVWYIDKAVSNSTTESELSTTKSEKR